MSHNSQYQPLRNQFVAGDNLPTISTQLDSVRTYQFECQFFGIPNAANGPSLTTAAKQVSPVGGATDDIVVDRVNDKMFYPGKFTPEAVTITFDNQLLTNTTPELWNWFKNTYNPTTGDVAALAPPANPGGGGLKANKLRSGWYCEL